MKAVEFERNLTMWMLIVLMVILIFLGPVAKGTEPSTTVDPVSQIKADFDAAMAQPLAQRISLLETLEQTADQLLFQGNLTSDSKRQNLYYKYYTQLQLAKYPSACQTYTAYLTAIKEAADADRAHAVFYQDMERLIQRGDLSHCAAVCERIGQSFAGEPLLAATALFYLAKSQADMISQDPVCEATCNKLIAEYPTSPWRPEAMRLLGFVLARKGDFDKSLAVLELLKKQYPNTAFEHYADMRPAAIWEVGKGDPQKALDIYRQTLERYPSHLYSPYIHQEIERLQKVIEEQLIQDALNGVARAKPQSPTCGGVNPIVKTSPDMRKQMVIRY